MNGWGGRRLVTIILGPFYSVIKEKHCVISGVVSISDNDSRGGEIRMKFADCGVIL